MQELGYVSGKNVSRHAVPFLVCQKNRIGKGGDLLLSTCRKVLDEEYPEYADKIQLTLPDEKFRRVGQSMAAASLPEMK